MSLGKATKNVLGYPGAIIKGMGGSLEISTTLLRLLPSNKVFKIVKKTLPLAVITADLIAITTNHFKKQNNSIKNKRDNYIQTILKTTDINGRGQQASVIPPEYYSFSNNVIDWIIKNDDMVSCNKVSNHNIDKFEATNTVDNIANGLVVFEYRDHMFGINISKTYTTGNGSSSLTTKTTITNIYASTWDDEVHIDFISDINNEYMQHLGIEEHVLLYHESITLRDRVKDVNFNFHSIDYNEIKTDINYALTNKCKRGHLFSGVPGTGKTSILLQIEKDFSHVPMVYVNPSNFQDEYRIDKLFDFLEPLGMTMLVIEDIDRYGLSGTRTNTKLAALLTKLDDSKGNQQIIVLATANNVKSLDPALIRPGRFDVTHKISVPKTKQEIFEVLKYRYDKDEFNENKQSFFINISDISNFTWLSIILKKLTHSDISEICSKLLIANKNFTNKNIRIACKEVYKSKKNNID